VVTDTIERFTATGIKLSIRSRTPRRHHRHRDGIGPAPIRRGNRVGRRGGCGPVPGPTRA
jgi:hypothetical protein